MEAIEIFALQREKKKRMWLSGASGNPRWGERERERVQRQCMCVGCSRVTKKTKATWRCVSRLICSACEKTVKDRGERKRASAQRERERLLLVDRTDGESATES